MMKIGTSGFRGVVADEFTRENICKIMQVTSDIILEQGFKKEVILGYDNRFMAEIFAKWCCEVLGANGIKVTLAKGNNPSPLVSYAGRLMGCDISIMITASHNPYYYNGIKIFSHDGRDLEKYLEEKYTLLLDAPIQIRRVNYDEVVKHGLVTSVDFTEDYVNSIISLMLFKEGITTKTIFHAMNGGSVESARLLKKTLNLDMEIMGEDRDALFALSAPIPSEEKLEFLKEKVKAEKLDFAFATDGDGDRLGVIDDEGNYLCGNEIASLIYYFAIKEKKQKGPFVKNFSYSLLADKVCKYFGSKVIETPIGFKYIGEEVVKNKAILGAENSGIEFPNHALTKDGLAVYALLLEIVSYYNKPLSQIIQKMKLEVGYDMSYREISFEVKDREVVEEAIKKGLPTFERKLNKTQNLDGTKLIFTDGSWILIRFSGTERLLRLVCEAVSQKERDEILENYKTFIENL